MYSFLMVVHIFAAVFLMIIVLIQPAKGGGLTGAFGTGGGQAVFGVRTGDVMTRITTVTAVIFTITSLSLAALTAKQSSSIMAQTKQNTLNTLPVVNDADLKDADMTDSKKAVSSATDNLVEKMKSVFKKENKTTEVGTEVSNASEAAATAGAVDLGEMKSTEVVEPEAAVVDLEKANVSLEEEVIPAPTADLKKDEVILKEEVTATETE